jgi:hypothetical protein
MPEGSTENPDYPHQAASLFAFCTEGLDDPNAMLRRLLHAERDDMTLSPEVVAQVREAIWDLASRLLRTDEPPPRHGR